MFDEGSYEPLDYADLHPEIGDYDREYRESFREENIERGMQKRQTEADVLKDF